MPFNFADPLHVLAGTIFGESRGCGRAAMENVAQCVLNRVRDKWDAGGLVGVCLAPYQFSCWLEGDVNRADILIAAGSIVPASAWTLAMVVAGSALDGRNPNRLSGADSYYAVSSPRPYWAKPPGRQTYGDGWHAFWITRAAPHAPVISVNSNITAESLNAIELGKLGA